MSAPREFASYLILMLAGGHGQLWYLCLVDCFVPIGITNNPAIGVAASILAGMAVYLASFHFLVYR
ncbi:MAG: hypothetical protein ACXWUC_03110 [Methylosarcina sp.]